MDGRMLCSDSFQLQWDCWARLTRFILQQWAAGHIVRAGDEVEWNALWCSADRERVCGAKCLPEQPGWLVAHEPDVPRRAA